MAGFRTTSHGVTARFAKPEAAVIRDLVGQVADLIAGTDPADPSGSGDLADLGAPDSPTGRDSPRMPDSPTTPDSPSGPDGPSGLSGSGDLGGPDDLTDSAGLDEPTGLDEPPGASGRAGAGDRPRRRAGAGEPRVPGADELTAMLGLSDNTELPDDPILARLLPDGYRDDPDSAQDFRRFTESGLRSGKVAAAQIVLATLPPGGGRVRLSAEDAEAWLRALNDVRLALGVRLGVTEDFDGLSDDVGPEDLRYAYVQVYQWLAYLQESLVAALS